MVRFETQDRDDNPFKLSPRFKNKTIVVKREPRHCGDIMTEYGVCLSANNFDISKCTDEMKATERCVKELNNAEVIIFLLTYFLKLQSKKQPHRTSPFNYHLRRVIANKYRVPLR
ncbi:putative mitochondrial protein [Cavenderia fasciculata]|uniref:Mitochondrial protein n=1 Tax=Cavenderia fasciculata TaxID=261658 RepID=F4Q1W9_CACFS|nr:putative mitochondrial protein [Cavenderia fasciculata]EGG17989.1 putative mitochondrial protein [Cavenderia fasciculata]|eukprot:XP_004356881.1 putative mitochondrial protein [Cavenderia fasciculata]